MASTDAARNVKVQVKRAAGAKYDRAQVDPHLVEESAVGELPREIPAAHDPEISACGRLDQSGMQLADIAGERLHARERFEITVGDDPRGLGIGPGERLVAGLQIATNPGEGVVAADDRPDAGQEPAEDGEDGEEPGEMEARKLRVVTAASSPRPSTLSPAPQLPPPARLAVDLHQRIG